MKASDILFLIGVAYLIMGWCAFIMGEQIFANTFWLASIPIMLTSHYFGNWIDLKIEGMGNSKNEGNCHNGGGAE